MQEEQHPQVRQLRKQMVNLLAQTRENEEKAQRYRSQESRFLATESMTRLIETVLVDYKQAFELDAVTLVLDDPDYEIQRALEDGGVDLSAQNNLQFLATQYQLRDAARLPRAPQLGPYSTDKHGWLFPKPGMTLQSVAEIPLNRGDRVIGSLSLGSTMASRFPVQAKAGLLVSLANVLAVCVENALNKVRIERVGLTDALTGVANKKYLVRRLEEETERCKRSAEPMACLFIEIDNFDALSTRYGRRAADESLISLADIVGAQLRGSDTVARFEGATFAVLLVRSSPKDSGFVADRIREVVSERSFDFDGQVMPVSISTGVAALRGDSDKTLPRNIADRICDEAADTLKKAAEGEGNKVVSVVLN